MSKILRVVLTQRLGSSQDVHRRLARRADNRKEALTGIRNFSQQPEEDRKTQTCLVAQRERFGIGETRNMKSAWVPL